MEENSGQTQTENLLQDLSAETLSTDYNTLKEQYDDLAKRELEARQELERTRNLLVESQKASATTQQDKENAENKLADTTNLKHESMSLVSSLRQSMALLRSENSKLSQETKECSIKMIKVQTEKDAEHYQNEMLKLQNSGLNLRLNNLIKSEQGTRQALLTAEADIKRLNEAMRGERERAASQQSILEKERDSLLLSTQDLREQLTKSNTDKECANKRAETAEKRIENLESNRLATKKNHDDLIELYEKQRRESDERIAQFTEEMERSQQKTSTDRTQLEQDNEKLKNELAYALDKLQVTRSSLDKLIGKDNTTTASNDDASPTSDIPYLRGSLLDLMKQYESTGRQWDDIFGDYFDLRSSSNLLSSVNNELTNTNKQLMRERDDLQQFQDLLESEVERLRTERASQSSLSDDYTKLKISSTQQLSQLKDQADELRRVNQDLHASLNDSAYQLRYLIRHVESEIGNLPAEIQQPSNLLVDANIPSTLGHEKTVFKDISELQQRNQELLTEVRHLSTQLEEKTTEARSNANTAKETHALLTDTTAKSTALIRDQNEKIEALQLRLSMISSERDRLLKHVPAPGSESSVVFNSMENQEKLQQADQKYQELLADTTAYRHEMELELQDQREELKNIRDEAVALRQEYNGALLTIDQHKQRNIGLSQVCSSRQSEIDDLRRRASARESLIGDQENHILNLNNEIASLSHDIDILRNDHLSITAQLSASNTNYQRLLNENKDLANERVNLKTLLQDMNEKLASSTTGTTHLMEELNQQNKRLSRELQNLQDTLAAKEKELHGYQAVDQSEWKDKYQTSVGELKQLKTRMLDLEQKLATADQDRMVAQAKLNEALKTGGTGITTDGSDDTSKDGAHDPISEQAKQLSDANIQITSLKKELIDVKERLADADATVSKITQEYNTFISESQVRIEKLSDDLSTSNQKVGSMQEDMEKMSMEQKETKAAHSTSEQQWESIKATLTQENQDLATKTTTLSAQINDLQAQLDSKVEELQRNEERYQTQVADRAKDADTIGNLRDEVRQLNTDIMTSKTEVLGAQERLRSAELSYRNQKELLETEQNEMKLRLEESQKQQEALAIKIQELVSKISELQTSSGSMENGTISHLAESAVQQLRDVNASLRHEKDTWYARYTEAQHRANRLESDLEFVQHQLSTTRALLETARAEKDQTARKQADGIKEAQNEAAIYKEDNASLRIDVEKRVLRITELESLLVTKESEIEPLKLKSQGLEHELKQANELVQTLKGKQEELNARSAQLLSKHNKSDPQEVEKLKAELEQVKTQLEEKTQALNTLEKEHQELVTKSAETEEKLQSTTENNSKRARWIIELRKTITTLQKTVAEQKEQLAQQEQKQKQQQPEQKPKKQQPEQPEEPQPEQTSDPKETQTKPEDAGNTGKIKELEDNLKKLEEEKKAQTTKYSNLLARARALMAENKTHATAIKTLTDEKAALAAQIEELGKQLAAKTSEASTLQVEIGRLKAMHSMTTNKNEKLKKQVSELQQKLQGGSTTTETSSPTEPESKPSPIPATSATTIVAPASSTSTSPSTPVKRPQSPAVGIPPTETPAAATPPPPSHTEAPAKEETPTMTTSPVTTTAVKRGPEDDLDSQPPVKK